jgi:hypothetical protein
VNREDVPFVLTADADSQLNEIAAVAPCRKSSRDGPAAVHDQEVAGAKEAPEPDKVGMFDRPGGAVDHHQAHTVAAPPA